jgi:flagellar L-ring protein precursor FlgH
MRRLLSVALAGALVGCAVEVPQEPYAPSMKYVGSGRNAASRSNVHWKGGIVEATGPDGRAQMKMADTPPVQLVQFQGSGSDLGPGVRVMRSSEQLPEPYRGPLDAGDPGVTASLWRESQGGNEPFRDFRAWQAMDLVTIVVNELSLGQQLANTEVKSKSAYLAAIENFFGLEQQTQNWSNPPDLTSVIQATTQNDFRGEGRTIRQAQLNARISAVVAEVLPSGLLRIEGEKIIAVNNEEQVMVISGLVRQRDINSNNEVNASQIAQIRIDYYGKGTVGEAQYGGWLSRLLRILWPF